MYLFTRDISIEWAAFITVISPWDWDQIGIKLETKSVKS